MSEHVHRFKITPATTQSEPYLRCDCGMWTSTSRLKEATATACPPKPFCPSFSRGLESRLGKCGPDAPGSGPWPDNPLPVSRRWPELPAKTTPDLTDIFSGRRKP